MKARRSLQASVEQVTKQAQDHPLPWSEYRGLEQLLESAAAYLDATAPRPRGRRRSVSIVWCEACDGPAPGLDCPVCEARLSTQTR